MGAGPETVSLVCNAFSTRSVGLFCSSTRCPVFSRTPFAAAGASAVWSAGAARRPALGAGGQLLLHLLARGPGGLTRRHPTVPVPRSGGQRKDRSREEDQRRGAGHRVLPGSNAPDVVCRARQPRHHRGLAVRGSRQLDRQRRVLEPGHFFRKCGGAGHVGRRRAESALDQPIRGPLAGGVRGLERIRKPLQRQIETRSVLHETVRLAVRERRRCICSLGCCPSRACASRTASGLSPSITIGSDAASGGRSATKRNSSFMVKSPCFRPGW